MAGEWTTAALGALCEFRAGSAFKLGLQGQSTGRYPFVKVSDMNLPANAVRIQDANNWVSEDDLRELRARPLPPGSVIFAKIGEALRQNRLRQVVRATVVDNNMMGAVPRPDAVDPRFFYYALSRFDFSDIAQGTALPYLTTSALSELTLDVPPLPEQRAIADILGAFDDKIELNRRMNEMLEAMARTLFKSWFVDFDPVYAKAEGRDPGLPGPIADLFPDRFEDSERGEIPVGWRVVPLGSIAEVAIGGDWGRDSPGPDDVAVRCLRGVDLDALRRKGWADAPQRFISRVSLDRRRPQAADVLVEGSGACGRALAFSDAVGAVYPEPVIYSNFCKRFTTPSAATGVFLQYVLNGLVETGEMKAFVTGTAMPNLDHKGLLTGLAVAVPPDPVLNTFGALAESIRQRLFSAESRTLAAVRDALLPKLISGELRVPQAEATLKAAPI